MKQSKPIHAKPSLYAYYFESLKEISMKYGYNLVLHGSLNRDLDLILIPWQDELGSINDLMKEFCSHLGAKEMYQTHEQINCFPHGRMSRVINLNRDRDKEGKDKQYYIDISVIPVLNKTSTPSESEPIQT